MFAKLQVQRQRTAEMQVEAARAAEAAAAMGYDVGPEIVSVQTTIMMNQLTITQLSIQNNALGNVLRNPGLALP